MQEPLPLNGDLKGICALAALQASLPVRLIETRKAAFRTCRSSDSLAALAARREPYDHLPVVEGAPDGRESVIGLLNLRRLQAADQLSGIVADEMERLGEQNLIGADASIIAFLRDADRFECRLIVSGAEITGLVTLSDIEHLPVRAALFASITNLELTMSALIDRELGEGDAWMGRLSPGRLDKLRGQIEHSREAGGLGDALLATQFCDKRTIVATLLPVAERRGFRRELMDVEVLRDRLAHANQFANSRHLYLQVCQVVRLMESWSLRLENLVPNNS